MEANCASQEEGQEATCTVKVPAFHPFGHGQSGSHRLLSCCHAQMCPSDPHSSEYEAHRKGRALVSHHPQFIFGSLSCSLFYEHIWMAHKRAIHVHIMHMELLTKLGLYCTFFFLCLFSSSSEDVFVDF